MPFWNISYGIGENGNPSTYRGLHGLPKDRAGEYKIEGNTIGILAADASGTRTGLYCTKYTPEIQHALDKDGFSQSASMSNVWGVPSLSDLSLYHSQTDRDKVVETHKNAETFSRLHPVPTSFVAGYNPPQ